MNHGPALIEGPKVRQSNQLTVSGRVVVVRLYIKIRFCVYGHQKSPSYYVGNLGDF